jgi:hypothetical protein
MKNLYLFGALIVLLTIVYFTQEKKAIDEVAREDFVSQLVVRKEHGRLMEIQTPYNHLVRKGEQILYFENDFKVNEAKINEFLKRIANIRAKKKIPKDEVKNRKDFFPEEFPKISFRMEKGVIEFRLGKKLDFSQDFYVEVIRDGVSEFAIAHDTTPYEGMVYNQSESHRSDHKYQRVKALFYLPVNFFMDLRIFHKQVKDQTFKFTNIRNKSFQVDFLNKTTEPKPIAGIKVSTDIIHYLRKKLESFEAEVYLKIFDESKVGRKVGDVETSKGHFQIYESYGNDNRYYIKAPGLDGLFKIKHGEQRLFLFNVQNMWDLKPFDKISGDISITFDSGETLVLGTHQFGLKANHALTLLKTAAKYILDDITPNNYKNPKLQLELDGRNIEFHFTEREIILVDKKLKISYHYERLDKKYISIDPDDYRVEK